ncbi:FAD-binding oxidoreductase [Ferrovibrio sp.]|uniref:NAD(P)/FAD-dependent oxidoreductase n=1 Tax=Ferrovibrio sp. TaxID=1917215 RepID=UPI00311F786B
MSGYDVIVVGAGIAGASVAWALSRAGLRVLVLEREAQPGYHSTGRSAALYAETYGSRPIRALTTGSKNFYLSPPEGFCSVPLLTPRGAMFIARDGQQPALERVYAAGSQLVGNLRLMSGHEAEALVPALLPGYAVAAMMEPDAMDIDVAALHQGFLRGLRAAGGIVETDAELLALGRAGSGDWQVETRSGRHAAPVVVNAAGAWADEIGRLAGAAPVGLVPKRRTAATFDPPAEYVMAAAPMVIDAEESFYFKPDAGRILVSPADETPSPPCDAQPDEYDIAVMMERLAEATAFRPRRLASKWAGLRSFVADKSLVAGFDPAVPGFFWLAGQGGYGVQTAPAAGRAAAALIRGGAFPEDLVELGLSPADLSPSRPGLRQEAA